jgi:3-oxoacyl-[acyl-carrier protein] reductase
VPSESTDPAATDRRSGPVGPASEVASNGVRRGHPKPEGVVVIMRSPRRALVTGSTSGIGYATADRLLRDGVQVIVHSRDAARAIRTRERLSAYNYVAGDLSTKEGVQAVIDAVRVHDIDILVNNAADIDSGHDELLKTSRQRYERMMGLHAWAGMELSQALLPGMLERDDHGRIIWMSSEGAMMPKREHFAGPYLASKFTVLVLSRLFADEARGTSVTSNAVIVGPTRTERTEALTREVMPGHTLSQAVGMMYPASLAGRPAEPTEVADVVAFLASPASTVIRGAAVPAHGGVIPTVTG